MNKTVNNLDLWIQRVFVQIYLYKELYKEHFILNICVNLEVT